MPVIQFARFLRECGFETGNGRLGFHSLRSSHATYAVRAGATLAAVQKQLAHSSAKTTEGYLHLTEDDKRRELRASHRPLLLPGPDTETARLEIADRDRLADLARTLPIAAVRRLLSEVPGER